LDEDEFEMEFYEFYAGGFIMIKKDKKGYKVVSEKGKNLGSGYKTRAAAAKRLRQVEYFKHKG
jgi:CRISPR/Cas system CMR-associated protein Cmr3 (group 5 of RAMP superfamily)